VPFPLSVYNNKTLTVEILFLFRLRLSSHIYIYRYAPQVTVIIRSVFFLRSSQEVPNFWSVLQHRPLPIDRYVVVSSRVLQESVSFVLCFAIHAISQELKCMRLSMYGRPVEVIAKDGNLLEISRGLYFGIYVIFTQATFGPPQPLLWTWVEPNGSDIDSKAKR